VTPRGWAALAALLVAGLTPAPGSARELPAWVEEALARPIPTYGKKVHAVVLSDEGRLAVGPDGTVTRSTRRVIRILDRDGAQQARVVAGYETDLAKVRELRAWLLRQDGGVKTYGAGDALDVAQASNDVYNESRAKIIDARGNVLPGVTFAYEVVVEMRRLFASDIWMFQRDEPVLSSVCVVSVPAGWRVEGQIVNGPALAPRVVGSNYIWELKDLAPIEDEVAAPPAISLAARLCLRYFAPAGSEQLAGDAFSDWTAVSRWMTALAEPQAAPSAALTAKARELAQGAQGEWQQIAAVAKFVQSIQYISIQIGLGRYRPHAASDVLAKSYGDCKDKANLMLALLRALGIQAHLVLARASAPEFVRPEWPAPQFDHCILAIVLKSPSTAPAVVQHERLGRLLIFDPTDPYGSLGDLPEGEQGGWGLLAAGADGGLIHLPLLSPSDRRVERQLDVSLAGSGALAGRVAETSWGQSGRQERAALKATSGTYTRRIEAWLAAGLNGARATSIEPKDRADEGRFDLIVSFSAASAGQLLQNRLLLFRPVLLSRRDSLALSEPQRTQPIQIAADAFRETTRIALPAGFAIDELPEVAALNAPFGQYTLKVEGRGEQITVTREMTLQHSRVAASEYASVKQFFEQVAAAEQSRVVLVKQ
jgi:hypothetical protein